MRTTSRSCAQNIDELNSEFSFYPVSIAITASETLGVRDCENDEHYPHNFCIP